MLQCICVDYDDGDGPVQGTFRSKIVKGRKDYRCCECGRLIPRGTRHEADQGVWDGAWQTYRTCLVCSQVRSDFMECGWVYGELWETLRGSLMERQDHDEEEATGSCWLTPPT